MALCLQWARGGEGGREGPLSFSSGPDCSPEYLAAAFNCCKMEAKVAGPSLAADPVPPTALPPLSLASSDALRSRGNSLLPASRGVVQRRPRSWPLCFHGLHYSICERPLRMNEGKLSSLREGRGHPLCGCPDLRITSPPWQGRVVAEETPRGRSE